MFRFTTIVLAAVGVPAVAAGQGRAAVPGHPVAAGRSGAALVHAAPVTHPVTAPTARASIRMQSAPPTAVRVVPQQRSPGSGGRVRSTHRVNTFPPADFSNLDSDNVPGLGFDFPHLAAINANRAHHRRRFGSAPFLGGFLLTAPSVIIEQPIPVEEQTDAEETEAAASNVVEDEPVVRRRRKMREPELDASAAPAAEPAPQREMDQFVFVRRDGSLVFAVAYTWVEGTLRYITPEGMRRTIARDALDLNATQQFNEQRGVSFRAPA